MSTAAKKTVQKRAPAAHPSYKEMAMAAVKATHTKKWILASRHKEIRRSKLQREIRSGENPP